jgi:hypothetical protein
LVISISLKAKRTQGSGGRLNLGIHPAFRFARRSTILGQAERRYAASGVIVTFPDGSRVRASSILDRRVDDPERSFGLYLDARWQPSWPADLIEWEDLGLPEDADSAARMIEAAFMRARRGELVEVGCLGGIGRTGTVLACMAVLAGVPPVKAVAWVRDAYKTEAVETAEQEDWVRWFADRASSQGDPA